MAAPKTIRLFEEIAVLNDILRENSNIYKLRQCIDPYSVPIKRHRILRKAIGQLHALNHSIDLTSLACYLADHDLLEEIGGCRYLQYVAGFHQANVTVERVGLPIERHSGTKVLGDGVSR